MNTDIPRAFASAIGAVITFLIQAGFGMLQVGGIQSSKSRYMVRCLH